MQKANSISRRALLACLGALPLGVSLSRPLRAETLPLVTVSKDPSCGCCGGWITHIEAAGFPVRVIESEDMSKVKQRLGVPLELSSCHTAEVDGYVIEGHVPAAAMKRLLADRPTAIGLAAPGMPAGSPGMDFPGVEPDPYEVVLFDAAGYKTFLRFLGAQEI